MGAWLLYENIFADGTLSSNGDADGFPKENVADWRLGTPYRWKSSLAGSLSSDVEVDYGSSILPDTLCIGGHNQAAASAVWRLQRGAASPPTTEVVTIATTTLTNPFYSTFSSTTSRYWRIKKDSGGTIVPQIGVITLGRRVDLDRLPVTVDVFGEEAKTEWNKNLSGSLIGSNFRYIRKRFVFNFDPAGLLASTLDTAVPDFQGAVVHMRDKPIWFCPGVGSDTDRVYLCRLERGVRQPFIKSTLRRSPRFTLVASGSLL